MGALIVQHHVRKQGHKVVIHSLLPRETNIQETYLGWSHFFTLATYSNVWIENLVLVIPLCSALPLYFPFRPRDRLDDQSVLLSPPFLPVCTKSDVLHTKFPHPHFISCLNQVLPPYGITCHQNGCV